MRIVSSVVVLSVLTLAWADAPSSGGLTPQTGAESHARRITWQDVGPLHARLEARGFSAADFSVRIDRLAEDNARRVHLGDLDHLVFFALQSTRFTRLPAMEPALSARALVDDMDPADRDAFFADPASVRGRVNPAVRARLTAFLRAIAAPGADARLAYFGRLVGDAVPAARDREAALVAEYLRVMRFVYEKEFGAGRSTSAAAAALYRTRGLSTDTAVEAGFLVSQGLGVLRGLQPDRRVRRVLIIGAGLDIAPRTALLEAAPPQSYQPWAVLDALIGLGLARLDEVEIVAADINPRVVDYLQQSRTIPPQLLLVSGIGDDGRVALAGGYREYFEAFGRSLGQVDTGPRTGRGMLLVPAGHLFKRVQVSREAAQVLHSERFDVVTERIVGRTFDLVVATNVFPYFDDDALMLAVANIAGMLDGDGVLLHNEPRPTLFEIAAALGLPPWQSRHAIIATVRGAPPLGDSIWLHGRHLVANR
ncbi:hypothetical protein [Luteitalea pratensis]|uniref:hypothetical protein n=1 Tax=Luteitalea pratensis TaxID=1855912 RepID=UPI000D729707|nr:hypothetical protein [Luteitalea pratensis]